MRRSYGYWLGLFALWFGPGACRATPSNVAPPSSVPSHHDTASRGSQSAATAAQADTKAAPAPQPAKPGIPSACADANAELCVPPLPFVKQLCRDGWPTIALVMFSKDAPWTRGYLRGKVSAWNASGGGSNNATLEYEEEVVVLRHRSATSADGMLVSGATGGYDVMRLNGDCVTLAGGELQFQRPPSPKHPRIIWEDLEVDMRDALRKDEQLNRAYINRKKTCKGKYWGTVSAKCEKADGVLVDQIARVVREGGKLASPNRLPGRKR